MTPNELDSQPNIDPRAAEGLSIRQGNPTRRRLISGAAGGLGVLLAVQAKTALGQQVCQSPSAMMSGNTSPRPETPPCSGGRSPGFWKQPQHFSSWAVAGATPPTFKPGVVVQTCVSGMQGLSLKDLKTPGTLASTALGGSVPGDPGIWAVLAFPNSFVDGMLVRHLCAAWLNAGYFPDYAISRTQIQAMWAQLSTNGNYCPGNVTCTDPMTKDDVKAYIEGLYDFNADLTEPDLCKKK
ncbi:hypothetical protein [Azoarcus olearius]|uniref:Uncharacterized protein n=1 Tax=Azoarcus sp. (strain BH72) TaxID=418699 RepID=A1K449_AZOSB|nr:hypothetical protein [Azoarcus olearius]ANQ84152.1 hypothetical protein dqs_1088 [Azoarcus olearius]CAL93604.1 hypothetical protein predicted by Glimmer/Critica [Azoarcus olearius]